MQAYSYEVVAVSGFFGSFTTLRIQISHSEPSRTKLNFTAEFRRQSLNDYYPSGQIWRRGTRLGTYGCLGLCTAEPKRLLNGGYRIIQAASISTPCLNWRRYSRRFPRSVTEARLLLTTRRSAVDGWR